MNGTQDKRKLRENFKLHFKLDENKNTASIFLECS